MLHTKQKAFTLVELIVVVTILAILATIGFVSYSSYLTGVRDTNRLAQLVAIHDGMELYRTKNDLPLPDENISIMASGAVIAYQGYAGSNTLETIDFTKGGKDPKDGDYFSYYLTQDRKYFQLLAFLEEEENLSTSVAIPSPGRGGLGRGVVNAADLTNRISTVYGKKLGIMTNTSNTPLQEVVTTSIDLVADDTSNYVAHLTDSSTLTGSTAGNSDLEYLENTGIGGGMAATCKTIIDKNKSVKTKDGIYLVDPSGSSPFPVYCDMTTDGGGWTMIVSDGTSAFTASVETLSDVPSPTETGMVDYFVNNTLKKSASEMRIVSIADTNVYGEFDITPSWLGDMNLGNSDQGYMYASNKGFGGGALSMHKCNIAIYLSSGCIGALTYPSNGITLGALTSTVSAAYGTVAFSWKFQDGSNLFRVGWATPTGYTGYYDAATSSYLLIR